MADIKFNRGLSSNLPIQLHDGWIYFCTDTGEFHVDFMDNGILTRKTVNSLSALQKSGDTMGGILKFLEGVHYGASAPTFGEEGQIYFSEAGAMCLQKSGDTMEGVLKFTEIVHFGGSTPETGEEGQIFFVEGEDNVGATATPFAVIEVEYPAGSTCTCTSSDGQTVLTAKTDSGKYLFLVPYADTWTVSCTDGLDEIEESVIIDSEQQYTNIILKYVSSFLENNSWEQISIAAASGQAQNYWSVGDCKAVDIKGTVGSLSLDTTLYVYIIGFNHNGATGTIDFGTFKTAASDGVDVCLISSNYGGYDTGASHFSMNHWGTTSSPYNRNFGGWKGCDLRYDILGSTDTAPSGYGQIVETSRAGYDASATCAVSPVPNTLMAALPSDLRAVMKPMTVYTDNVGNSSNVASGVSASVDYMPLPAEFEIFGTRKSANTYEQNYQAQYTYYINGNTQIKYKHSETSSYANWWLRSPTYNSANYFCWSAGNIVSVGSYYSRISYGLAPIFRV